MVPVSSSYEKCFKTNDILIHNLFYVEEFYSGILIHLRGNFVFSVAC